MCRTFVLLTLFVLLSPASYGETYKCKSASGAIEISDQPCRGTSTTEKVVSKEYISESQRRSSTDWINSGQARLQRKDQEEAIAQQQAQRQEAARQAALREEQHKQQEANRQQQLVQEMQQLRQEQAAATEAARRAEQAANNAAANNKNRGPVSCKQRGGGWIDCQ